jgi:site-specific DNA-methyltransferase (adenine-specific)
VTWRDFTQRGDEPSEAPSVGDGALAEEIRETAEKQPNSGREDLRPETIRFVSGVLYCGDNLEVLRECVPDGSVDLVYLDPPFNSRRTYNIVYKNSQAQAEAFKDHWSWEEAAPQYLQLLENHDTPQRVRTLLRGLKELLVDDDADLLAYLAMMAPRLFLLHQKLKENGCLYLHCDPTASHYLKILLDASFGPDRFTNEVIWKRTNVHSDAKRWSPVSDTILFYCKGREKTWNPEYAPHSDEYLATKYRYVDEDGRRYRLDNMTSPNPRPNMMYEWRGHASPLKGWRYSRERMAELHAAGRIWYPDSKKKRPQLKRYLDEMSGTVLGNVWTDIDPINSQAKERVGYPTQKPIPLLERIISASSNEGDVVLDPFCGCGTTIEACEKLGRRWIGIDIAAKAVEVTERRFADRELPPPSVEWFPPDIDAALELARRSGLKFEAWVRTKVRAVKRKKDRGVDGEAFFRDSDRSLIRVIVSVKGGKLNPAMVRELRGTIERERSPIGVLITAKAPSKEMLREATHAGYLAAEDSEGRIPRIQIVTVDRLFSTLPAIRAPGVNVTEMPKPIIVKRKKEQLSLRLEPPKPPRKTRPGKSPEKTNVVEEVSPKRRSSR